jgi:DegV family protein with EDD domain
MAGVRIVTDSSCDLSQQEADELGIEIVPLSIRFGSEEYTDRRDLSVEDFYKKMAASEKLPETAAPSPGAFEQAFRNAAGGGADAIVCLNLSSQLSATMQSAQTAVKAFDDIPVRVLDSGSITSGLGTQVLLAARAAADGADLDDLVALVEQLRARTRVFGTLDTLENLKKGGRIGGAKALIGSVLSIKPILDMSSGSVEEAGKARTRRKAFQWLRERVAQDGAVEHLAVVHGQANDADDMVKALAPEFGADQIRVGAIGPVIGTHTGAGTVGVTWLVPNP